MVLCSIALKFKS